MILVGAMGGGEASVNLLGLIGKRLRVMGTVLRARPLEDKIALTQQFRRHVLPLLAAGKVKPVVDRVFPLDEVAEAHRYMEENRNFGKIVLSLE
jgi:NADPH:quinone reductase-like Zn-dependent oxidoreductase